MKIALRIPAFLALTLGVALIACRPAAQGAARVDDAAPDTTQRRTVDGRVFVSTYLPELRVEIDEAFAYVGHVEFDLKGLARVDRHVFVDADGARVERMIVFQFEGFLDDNDHTYHYRFTNPMTLGGATYNQNTYFFDTAVSIARNPGAETDHTAAFLKEKGYELEDEQMTSRFVRVVDDARRHELILFYLENVSSTGYTLAEISRDGGIVPRHTALADGLTQRSLQSFTILEE